MGISRDSIHKRRLTGGKQKKWRKKRKHELARQPSNTKIGPKRISMVRTRGGNFKNRALFLETGNFSYLSLNKTKKAKIISVVYNSTNNELVRTNSLVKGSIIQIESLPFKEILQKKIEIVKDIQNKPGKKDLKISLKKNVPNSTVLQKEKPSLTLDDTNSGRLLARICSRPGQTGRADGYVLEGIELEFYMKKIQKKNQ
jgi:small subunit ribosomal protein S8e